MAKRLLYALMSLFVAWHTFAIVVAPAPRESESTQSLQALVYPYIHLLTLGDRWDFYAPSVDRGHQLRYSVRAAGGKTYDFVPYEELNWHHPAYWWFRAWYDAVLDSPQDYGDNIGAFLCQKHSALKPLGVTLFKAEELAFTQADYLAGKRPLDSEFVTVTMLRRVRCKRT
jgi:hypothetical protein